MEREKQPSELTRRLEEHTPEQLKQLDQWVLWRYEGNPGEKPKKPPYATNGSRASVTNPQSWTTFDQAINAYAHGRYEGIGLMLTKDLTVIDLDNCLDPQKKPSDQARQIIRNTWSYTEISPSGKGLHIFLSGNVPGTARRRGTVEMYDTARYITFTGERYLNTPAEIRTNQEIIDRLHKQFIQPPTSTRPAERSFTPLIASDNQVIEKATRAKNGAKFTQLWQGNNTNSPSPSEANLALCASLAYWTNGDPNQIDRLFRQSGQWNEETAKKWDTRHGKQTYGEMTIAKALDSRRAY